MAPTRLPLITALLAAIPIFSTPALGQASSNICLDASKSFSGPQLTIYSLMWYEDGKDLNIFGFNVDNHADGTPSVCWGDSITLDVYTGDCFDSRVKDADDVHTKKTGAFRFNTTSRPELQVHLTWICDSDGRDVAFNGTATATFPKRYWDIFPQWKCDTPPLCTWDEPKVTAHAKITGVHWD